MHRGNRRQPIFIEDQDRLFYLRLVAEYFELVGAELWAFCLMENHVHLIVLPRREDALGRGIGLAHRRFAQRQNTVHGWTGHLFENRFFSTALDEDYLWTAVHYVERNPVRAGIKRQAGAWPWSSARAHLGQEMRKGLPENLLSPNRPFLDEDYDWKGFLAEPEDKELVDHLRERTRTGRPCGDEAWILKWEKRLNRRLRPMRRGRKPKLDKPVRGKMRKTR